MSDNSVFIHITSVPSAGDGLCRGDVMCVRRTVMVIEGICSDKSVTQRKMASSSEIAKRISVRSTSQMRESYIFDRRLNKQHYIINFCMMQIISADIKRPRLDDIILKSDGEVLGFLLFEGSKNMSFCKDVKNTICDSAKHSVG